MFDHFLQMWHLTPDGEPIVTHSSHLLPVRQGITPAMLKIAREAEEKFGGALMVWWDGEGAAQGLAQEGDALLLERAQGARNLVEMVHAGQDDESSHILCDVIARLHAPRSKSLPELVPLTHWFQELFPLAKQEGGVLARAATVARELLAHPQDVGVLHGDIHHQNVLDFGARGWLAIDPKRLHGERGFDYANIFCNPDGTTALKPGRLARQVDVVASATKLERQRLLQWIVAWSGLSAAWMMRDGTATPDNLKITELAWAELNR